MLSLELAKRLKDAGFPQGLEGMTMDDNFQEIVSSKTHSYLPTLSELIEACGIYFNSLQRIHDDEWLAEGYKNFHGDEPITRIGHNPESAIANLWLALC